MEAFYVENLTISEGVTIDFSASVTYRMSTLPFLFLAGLLCLPSGLPKKVEEGSAATGLLHNGQPGKESSGLWQWNRGRFVFSARCFTELHLALDGAEMSEQFAETGSGAVSVWS